MTSHREKRLEEALRGCVKDLVAYQWNARDAAKTNDRWDGVSEKVQPTVNRAREALTDDGAVEDADGLYAVETEGTGCDTPNRDAGDALRKILSDKDAMLGVADRAIKRQREMMDGKREALEAWNPIQTAPEDTRVLLKSGLDNPPVVGVVKHREDGTLCRVLHYNGNVLVGGFHATHWRPLTAPPTVPVPEDVRGLPDEWRSKAHMSRSHADNLDGMDAESAVCASRADAHDEDADELDRALAQHSEPESKTMSDYDRSIHSNSDQYAWADFFLETWPECGVDRDTMAGWFANAMMAKVGSLSLDQHSEPGRSDDTARLDKLEKLGDPSFPWIARRSGLGRGYRLHQTQHREGTSPTVREAIDAAPAPDADERE